MIVLQAGVLVTLRGCHLLDGLVARGSIEARKKIVRCSGEEIVRGIVRDVKSKKWSGRIMC